MVLSSEDSEKPLDNDEESVPLRQPKVANSFFEEVASVLAELNIIDTLNATR